MKARKLQGGSPVRRYRPGDYLRTMNDLARSGANAGPRYDGGGRSRRGPYGSKIRRPNSGKRPPANTLPLD
jgi:hypothetical protein